MEARGWEEVDIVFVTGDAYVDHPAFAMALLGRVLEAHGYRVAILSQPDWRTCEPWKTFGRPRLFFGVSAGNMDSMINHYTANRKVRNDDAYSPGGQIGLRPDRATQPYCQRAREAYKGVPVLAGGVEASLRRLAHYDYWSDTVKRSIVLDAKADLVLFGMGEASIVEAARRLAAGETVRDLRDMRGVTYATGASEEVPGGEGVVEIPSFEEVKADKVAFAHATRAIHAETNPYNAKMIVQRHDRQTVVCTPPRLPETTRAMDFFYDLPYTRRAHPSYAEKIPAFEVVKDSVTIMRGCFGGCSYCSITTHQGRIVQSRSHASIVGEVEGMGKNDAFKGIVSDLGGPTANMYRMRCTRPEVEAVCLAENYRNLHNRLARAEFQSGASGFQTGGQLDYIPEEGGWAGFGDYDVPTGLDPDAWFVDPFTSTNADTGSGGTDTGATGSGRPGDAMPGADFVSSLRGGRGDTGIAIFEGDERALYRLWYEKFNIAARLDAKTERYRHGHA